MSDLRIHAALSPRVAVLSSPDVDRVIQLNGIPDLPTLLRPFEFSVERLSVRTSQLETRICDRFPLRFDPYLLFNPDAARAISSSHPQAPPRPSAVGQSHEELLDRVNHLIASNIKKWDAQVPRPISTATLVPEQPAPLNGGDNDNDDDQVDKQPQALDETLEKLRRGSLQHISPWFDAVQHLVFGQRTIAKHESFGHPVAVLLAVSSASPDPMNDFAKLYEATSQASPFPAHPYINTDTLKYYVLIHDVRTSGEDLASSKEILEQVKKTYGLHCCMLTINSAQEGRGEGEVGELASIWAPYLPTMPSSPNPAAPASGPATSNVATLLDEEDVKRIKGFIRELTAQSIVPFMERYVQHMGDHLANSRKGLTNRLFGASRKLFGGVASGDKGANGSSASSGLATSGGYDPHHEFYPYTSIEAQTRRLADFAFTIRDYKLAAAMYDLGRKDFSGDKASRHVAGATEMFGLSHLMIMYTSRTPPIDVDSYLSQACYEYDVRSTSRANSRAVEDNLALRATLLYYEAYRMLGYLRPAPAGLLRMSQRSDEVLAPLLLEQAALACLQLRPKPSLRKFALYLVTAAHRYQACGQKILSLRCYAQAAVVYRAKGWALIENHIEHELGMQAYNEGDSDGAVSHLIRLIRPSGDSSLEHERFLQDVQTAYKYSTEAGGRQQLTLPFAMLDTASAVLRFVPESSASATATVDDAVWERLEQGLVEYGLGERVMDDGTKRRRKRPTSQTSTQARQVPIDQTFWLEVEVRNPISVELRVDSIRPVLQSDAATGEAGELSEDQYEVEDAGSLTLAPFQQRRVRIALRVKVEAPNLRIGSVRFRLEETIDLTQRLDKKGPRLNKTKEHRTSVVYGPDFTLAISVHGPRPTLTAKILDPPQQMYLGQQVRLKVVLKNEGRVAIEDLRALCDQPESATFSQRDGERVPNHLKPALPETLLDHKLEPGEEKHVELVVRPVRTGDVGLAWLLPFSAEDGETYLSRLAFFTRVSIALQVSVQTRPTKGMDCTHEVIVEAHNILEEEEVRVEAISVCSTRWKLVPDGVREEVVIAPKQVWRGVVRVEAAPTEAGDEAEEYTATRLQDLLLSRDVRRAPPEDVSVFTTTHSYASDDDEKHTSTLWLEARKVWRVKTLAAHLPTMSARQRSEVFTLFSPTSELDVVLKFSAITSSHARGSVHVYGLSPGPSRSTIRTLTHPPQQEASKIRSLYAETQREKQSLLRDVVGVLGREDNPVVVERAGVGKWRVRNFSDVYRVKVCVDLQGDGWVGRKTLRCALGGGEVQEVCAKRRDGGEGETAGGGRYRVTVETFLGGEEEVLVGRYVEEH